MVSKRSGRIHTNDDVKGLKGVQAVRFEVDTKKAADEADKAALLKEEEVIAADRLKNSILPEGKSREGKFM